MQATWVAKLGGSLLEPPDLDDLASRLLAFVVERGGARPLLIVGGGPLVDAIRRWDKLFGLGEEFCHWLAVEALRTSAQLIERLLPRAALAASPEACASLWREGRLAILDCHRFLKDVDECGPNPLPRRWLVTTDSIAARAAERFGAPELALLKSTAAPAGLSPEKAAARGLVDPYFPNAAARLPSIVWVDLRAQPPAVARLRG